MVNIKMKIYRKNEIPINLENNIRLKTGFNFPKKNPKNREREFSQVHCLIFFNYYINMNK